MRLALLIDADNAPSSTISLILPEVACHGVANVRRAYGNWASASLGGWTQCLHAYAIRPIQQFAYTPGKNASDMAMVIDAMDLMHSGSVEGFAIVSSDADFTPLVMRLLTHGMKVYGFGEKKTPAPFVNACSQFTFVEALRDTRTDPGRSIEVSDRRALRADTRLVRMLRSAAEATADEDGWAHLGQVGHHIANQASLDPRNHGYRKLSDLIAATDMFEFRRRDMAVWIRDIRRR